MSKVKLGSLAMVAAVALMASGASASLIAPGGSFATPGDVVPTGSVFSGPSSTVFTPPSLSFKGTLTATVLSGDTTNPFVGSGGLTFVYVLSCDPTTLSDIGRLTINGFAGYQTDVSYETASSGVIPDLSTRNSGTGNSIGFRFGSPLMLAGQSGRVMVVRTNATSVSTVIASAIDGDVVSFNTLGAAPIPEPASLSIAGLGVAALLFRRRR